MDITKTATRTIRDGYALVRIGFKSLTEFEMYLRGDPPVNSHIFKQMMSLNAPPEFAGEPLEKALDYCHGGYRKNFDRFMELKKMMDSVNTAYGHGRRTVSSVVGSRPNIPSFLAGAPKTMYRIEKVKEKKFIDIYFNLAYGGVTRDEQVINRGLLTLNLVSLMEENGIGVNLYVFEACHVENEVFLAEISIKKPGEPLNMGKCFYPLCGKEFVRRLMLRLKESMPFKQDWGISYGLLLDETKVRELLGIGEKKLLILSPDKMGIYGRDLYSDADAFLDKLDLQDTISLPGYRKLGDKDK